MKGLSVPGTVSILDAEFEKQPGETLAAFFGRSGPEWCCAFSQAMP